MNKIEKIKEWVKKQKKEELTRNSIGVITGHTLFVDANELLSFLDTLSEEPSKSLQEEIETWIPAHISIRTDETLQANPTEIANACKEWGKCVARHFAEWQKNEIMKGSPVIMSPENFQGLIDSHAKRVEADYKEKMLKEAVKGDYDCNYYAPAIFLDKNLDGIKDGDKVKVIVLKEEEE